MNAEFNWWLLILGLVVGAGLVWLVLADSSRREAEIDEDELPMEAAWIAALTREAGRPIEPSTAAEVLRLHRVYLASPPPDDTETVPVDEEPLDLDLEPAPRGAARTPPVALGRAVPPSGARAEPRSAARAERPSPRRTERSTEAGRADVPGAGSSGG